MYSDVGYLLKVIQENADRHANQLFKPVDLTSSQVRVLKFLRGRKGEKTTQKDIENYLKVSHPTVVGIVQRLENKGFIWTEFNGQDKRNKYIYLTQKEEDLFVQMKNSHEKFENLLTAGMTSDQIEQLKELLQMIYDNVRDERRQ